MYEYSEVWKKVITTMNEFVFPQHNLYCYLDNGFK